MPGWSLRTDEVGYYYQRHLHGKRPYPAHSVSQRPITIGVKGIGITKSPSVPFDTTFRPILNMCCLIMMMMFNYDNSSKQYSLVYRPLVRHSMARVH